jgi:hypothetical protein
MQIIGTDFKGTGCRLDSNESGYGPLISSREYVMNLQVP